jgi:OOP family OmpA-OmpF porin
MKTKIVIFLILLAGANMPVFSQTIRVPIKKKVVNQVNTRANNDVDKVLDKGFDKIENGISGLFKKKKKRKHNSSAQDNAQADNSSQNQQTASGTKPADEKSQVNTPEVKWAKYDFVPGQTVIFEDKPSSDEENGEFPSRWDLYKGNAEIGEVNGEYVIMFLTGGTYIVPYLKNSKEDYLPDVFTMEMDVWFSKSSSTANRVYVYLGDIKNQGNRGGSNTELTIMPHSLEFLDSEKDYPGTEDVGWTVEKTGSWRHISIAYTKGKFKAYFNDTRLINIPHLEVNPAGITIESGNDNIFIKNIRIAKGGVKYYDRVLSDGKIVENGIRFDVNKATLKPESMGPINKIYKLMAKYPDLNFSVEGHTDSDGDVAANQKLSEARAKTVMDKLIAMGISADRLKSKGWGESKPIDTNATPEGKANNRRVEFVKF